MSDVTLPYFFRIDYYSTRKNGRVNQRCRVQVYEVERWEDLITSIMNGEALDEHIDELIIFDNIIKIEKVNHSVKIGDEA